MNFEHKSVLSEECIEGLNVNENGIYIDCTLGGAGHSLEICKKLKNKGRLIGIDQDPNALQKASEVLADYKNVIVVHDNFANINQILKALNIERVNGFLLDLGVSSHQLDEPSRGFSYNHDAPLDMRMNQEEGLSAYTVINSYSAERLTKLMLEYGEERWAKRIAQFIVEQRKIKPVETTFELVSIIKKAVPKSAREDGPHPAKRTFQAIRIEVNSELAILKDAVENMAALLAPGGRICIITFHSLEDRIIKNTFKALENPCTCPIDFPICICNKKPTIRIITRKPIIPTDKEIEINNRARSAKLRIAERLNS